jgi:hypothetical protein
MQLHAIDSELQAARKALAAGSRNSKGTARQTMEQLSPSLHGLRIETTPIIDKVEFELFPDFDCQPQPQEATNCEESSP